MPNVWFIEFEIAVSKALVTPYVSAERIPETLKYESLIDYDENKPLIVNSFKFYFKKESRSGLELPASFSIGHTVFEFCILACEVEAPVDASLPQIFGESIFHNIIDRISFFSLGPVFPGNTRGFPSEREGVMQTFVGAPFLGALLNITAMDATITGVTSGWLSANNLNINSNRKLDKALHWFRKGLSEQLLVDKYLLYWTCLEILCGEYGTAEYIERRCECGKTETRPHARMKMEKYLLSFSVPAKEAKNMWDLRQIVHGASLSAELESFLPDAIFLFEEILISALKGALGIDTGEQPHYYSARLTTNTAILVIENNSAPA